MKIQNNIMAMNTHRQYSVNNDNVSKSAEKLSSGYRINRAGDDAAGLAISEKMRSQIRGLNMSIKNSQDAISLVQTAEGALQEVHSMLQRMNELAVQSSTGTNESLDRNALSKEFNQLKREINDIAEQTTFNNMKILDGSMSNNGPQRSAATAGVYASVEGKTITDPAMSSTVTTIGKEASAGYVTIDFADFAGSITAGDTVSVAFNDGAAKTLTSAQAGVGGVTTAADLAQMFAGQTLAGYTIAVDGSKVTITSDTAGALAIQDAITVTDNGTAATIANATVGKVDGQDAVAQVATAEVDLSKLTTGSTFKVGNREYELVPTGGAGAEGRIGIEWTSTSTMADLVAGINATAPAGVTVAATATGFTVTSNTAGVSAGETDVRFSALESKQTSVEFDTVKLKAGDVISVSVQGTEFTYQFNEGDTVSKIAEGLKNADGVSIANSQFAAEVKGNTIIINGEANVDGFKPVALDTSKNQAIRIQVGALESEQLNISIESMNTKGLGLDEAGIATQGEAGTAITATRAAINTVSEQRSLLGAMQNRLTHKISNLKVSAENLTAAESRIRDVDIASEMTEFTKNNILSQAATAMLAQANSLPQNVLSLLR